MGNQASRKRGRTKSRDTADIADNSEPEGETTGQTDMISRGTPDSYDKLLSWMVEMAENDDVDVESADSSFVEHLTQACLQTKRHSSLVPTRQSSCESTRSYYTPPLRQHSLDSGTSRHSRSSRSREDLLHPKARFRQAKLSRQGTLDFSDDGSDAAMSTGCSGGSSFDSDADIVDPQTVLLGPYKETSFIKNNARAPRIQRHNDNTFPGLSNSVGDLLHVNADDTVRRKTKSLATMRRIMSESRADDYINKDSIPPITEENVASILDDNLLDRNMAEILYSVEALWPKGAK